MEEGKRSSSSQKEFKEFKQNCRNICQDFGKLMLNVLYQYLDLNNILDPSQSGFRPGHSTINQLLSTGHSIFKAFDRNPTLEDRSVYPDISKVLIGSGMRALYKNCIVEAFLANYSP